MSLQKTFLSKGEKKVVDSIAEQTLAEEFTKFLREEALKFHEELKARSETSTPSNHNNKEEQVFKENITTGNIHVRRNIEIVRALSSATIDCKKKTRRL